MAFIGSVQDDPDRAEGLVLDDEHHRSRKIRVEEFGSRHEQPAGDGHPFRIPPGQPTEPPDTSVMVFIINKTIPTRVKLLTFIVCY